MNFVLDEMTALRYFMPLIIEGNKRGITSNVFIGSNNKYTSPQKYLKKIRELSKQFKFKTDGLNGQHVKGVTFFVEGVGIGKIKVDGKIIVLTSLRDFSVIYDYYVKQSSNIIFPSKFFAEHYNTISEKNLYLGCPKYDIDLNDNEIRSKYDINNDKVALCIFPKPEFMNPTMYIQLLNIYEYFKQMGYVIVVKTRGKDSIPNQYRGDKYFEDYSWFPHTTMELIKISDIVMNFDSTSIKECIMLNKPLVNFGVKPTSFFSFLYNDSYAPRLNMGICFEELKKIVCRLVTTDLSEHFNDARDKYLYQPCNVSEKILDKVL